jgi:hypothetical protein
VTDLVEFLTAQYDRLEALARPLLTPPFVSVELYDGTDEGRRTYRKLLDAVDEEWVLADVESKREVLKLHHVVSFEDEDGHDIGRGCAECGYSAEYSDRGGWCGTVRLFAVPFSGEPGYDERWAI